MQANVKVIKAAMLISLWVLVLSSASLTQTLRAHTTGASKGSDTRAPGAVTDLTATEANSHSVQLTWHAPGNNGSSGRAAHYDVRYSTVPITRSNWHDAAEAGSELYQKPAGETMRYQANQLKTGVTYYFALKTADSSGNVSGLSNVVSATTYTPTPDKAHVSTLDELRGAIQSAPSNGRIISLAPGTYHQVQAIRIKDKNNITIRGASADYDATVIAGRGNNNRRTMEINFKLNNADYITFKNLTIEDSYYHAIQLKNGSDYFHADHVKTWDNGESGFKVTAPAHYDLGRSYSDYGLIENCLIGNTKSGQRRVVEGIDIVAAKGWVIRGNTIENIKKANGKPAYPVFAKGNSIGTVVEDNIVKNSFLALSFGGGGTGRQFFRNDDATYEHRGGIIRNNIAYNIKDTAIYMNKAHNFKVDNNTLMDVGQDGTAAIVSRFEASRGVIRNNLTDAGIRERDGGSATISNNVTDAVPDLFIKPKAGNYHLKPTADEAIDKGKPLPADVPRDIDGQSRPCGQRWDIGADEQDCHPTKEKARRSRP